MMRLPWHRSRERTVEANRALQEIQFEERQQREWFEVTLNSIGDAVVATDASGKITFVNPIAENLLGWRQEQLIGHPLTEHFALVNEYTRKAVENPISKVIEEGRIVGLANHTILVAEDGREFFIEDSAAPIRDPAGKFIGAILVFHDITERRLGELAQAELAAIVEMADDAIIAKNLNGTITSWNKGAERLFGYAAKEVIGRQITVLFPPDRTQEEDKILEHLKRGERVEPFETVRLRKDGQPVDVSVTISPIKDANGEIIGASKIVRDISRYKQNEKEREELLRREQETRSEAEAANRLKDEFLATVSHELRTPLSSILGWAALLRKGSLVPEAIPNAIEVIERNAKAQAQIVNDILDVSRIITGKLHLNIERIDLAPIIDEAVDTVRLAAQGKELNLITSYNPDAGLVFGDPQRLRQVVWNLLSNAVKFTPKGGRIEVRLQRIDSEVEIIVSDTGKGISQNFLPYIFERFRQADTSMARIYGGLGLGLAIVRHLVELHGGTVSVESSGEGQGSTFTVRIPLAAELGLMPSSTVDSASALEKSDDLTSEAKEKSALSGLRVLVVDDEEDARLTAAMVLTDCGAEVRMAGSAAEALDVIKQWHPDLLVSDLGMPGEDGVALIRKLRVLSSEEGGTIPAVALSGYARIEDRELALSNGYQAHLAKPVDPATLSSTLANLVKR
ncbi:MAG TPA: PAS domain S-box protein [Blastocatellia bacterium]|nr:PAS domain S-box protein [Blastocatellia bacterium]